MSDSRLESARAIAAELLFQFDPEQAYAGPILNRLLDKTEERQRATDLVFGTIRNLRAIDTVITKFSGRRIERISKTLLAVIRVGVYELVYNPDTPPHSIVNEAVNTTKRMGGKKQTGFVNAVLRGIVRHVEQRRTEQTEANAKRTLITGGTGGACVAPTGHGICFDTEILPDPQSDPGSYLSTTFSLPPWLVEEWLNDFGPERAREICFGVNRRPSVYVRVNPLKTTSATLLERLQAAGVQAESACDAGPELPPVGATHASPLRVTGPKSVAQLPGFAEGWFTVQDLSAANAVRLLDPQPGWKILDLCAAPGTKTMQLAEMTRDDAQIIATDINAKRLAKLDENLARLGFGSVIVARDFSRIAQGTNDEAGYDAVLLDVPCSNTGVLARRIEVRYRITQASVQELARTQRGLLDKAATLVKPGGRICYSTCSIQRAENGDLVRRFLAAKRGFELGREELILPSASAFDHDGAYAAILVKRSACV